MYSVVKKKGGNEDSMVGCARLGRDKLDSSVHGFLRKPEAVILSGNLDLLFIKHFH